MLGVSPVSGGRSRYWRGFLTGVAAMLAFGAIAATMFPSVAGLFVLGMYCIPTNSIFPLPHEPGVLYAAQYYDALSIAVVATTASVIVSFSDYALVEAWMRHPRLGAVQHTGMFRWAVKWMKRWPFAIVVLFSFLPLPISVIRILAPASGYPIERYLGAQIVGRLPRFFALAYLGQAFHFPAWILVAMFGALVVMFWLSTRGPRG